MLQGGAGQGCQSGGTWHDDMNSQHSPVVGLTAWWLALGSSAQTAACRDVQPHRSTSHARTARTALLYRHLLLPATVRDHDLGGVERVEGHVVKDDRVTGRAVVPTER